MRQDSMFGHTRGVTNNNEQVNREKIKFECVGRGNDERDRESKS